MIELLNKVRKAANEIAELRSQNPTFLLWQSIDAQLHFIISDFSDTGKFLHSADKERVGQIIMGLQAVREIESNDPELADLLCEIDYEYKNLYSAD